MFWTTCKLFTILTALTGIIYPVIITLIAQFTMPYEANGSQVFENNQLKGSMLIAQAFKSDNYFWPRPSATNYNPMQSHGSQLGPTSAKLKIRIASLASKLAASHRVPVDTIPRELVYSSASGLDPDLSMEAAYFQFNRIAKTRHLTDSEQANFRALMEREKQGGQIGFLGRHTINVLKLNRLLDAQVQPHGN